MIPVFKAQSVQSGPHCKSALLLDAPENGAEHLPLTDGVTSFPDLFDKIWKVFVFQKNASRPLNLLRGLASVKQQTCPCHLSQIKKCSYRPDNTHPQYCNNRHPQVTSVHFGLRLNRTLHFLLIASQKHTFSTNCMLTSKGVHSVHILDQRWDQTPFKNSPV